MRKIITITLLFILLLIPCCLAATTDDSTAALRDLNDRLERNKAEILKAVNDNQAKSDSAISKAIEDNFGVLDGRIKSFFTDATRSIAVIMVAAFMVGFTLSQIVRLKIEQSRRKAMVKMRYQLEEKVGGLQHEATELTKIVQELQQMRDKYKVQLESLKPKPAFAFKNIFFIIFGFIIGAATLYFLVVV